MNTFTRTLSAIILVSAFAGFGQVAAQNAIVTENALPGNPPSEWDVSGAGDANIQGFATDISINLGGTIDFKIKTDATSYYLDIYRLGYYQGNGARKVDGPVLPTATLPQTQPACLTEGTTNLLDCGNWGVSASWTVPANATSGIYFAKLVRNDGTPGTSHIVFVVRDDDGGSAILFQTADTTWQAYNRYGESDLFGGYSLYQGPTGHAFKVSYNRPFTTRGAPTEDWLFNAEYPMVRWLERNGYDVSYFTNIDADRDGAEILEHQVFLSIGHDEYWSAAQRTAVETARDNGVHLAFFSGNEIYWKIRWEDSIDVSGTPYRTLVCYKEGTLGELASGSKTDPLADVWTGLWRDGCAESPPADGCRPENELSGQISWVGTTGPITIPYEYSNHRFWRNTDVANLQPGEVATLPPGLLGYEWNPYQQAYAAFYPANIEWLSLTNYSGETHQMSLYEAPSGAMVFGAGTVQWSWGLDYNHDRSGGAEDVRVQQATVNLFGDMGVQPETLQPNLVPGLPCVPDCTGRVCGDDGCGGSCGDCEVGVTSCSELGACEPCDVDRCLGRECGDDGCGATCGTCPATETCEPVTGQCEALPCPCSLWDSTPVPAVDSSDSQAVELGVRFEPLLDGYITGIRFYKAPSNTGPHIGNLWTDGGALLATVTFSGETASGWQEAQFPSPIPVTAGQVYVASYHTASGYYSYDEYYFLTQNYENYPLSALADGLELGFNGVYSYGAVSSFPTDTWHSVNYWVDPIFNVTAEDLQPPVILSRTPSSGATGVTPSTIVTATFNEAIDEATLTFELRDPDTNLVSSTVTYDAPSRTATLIPDVDLDPSTTYTASVSGVEDLAVPPNAMLTPDTWTFTTGTPPGPPPDEGPGGPILVIADVADPFGRYFAEILRTEGLNYFTVTDVSLVTPGVLAQHEVAILGEMTLTADDVTMLTDWVTAGGKLIAMRPDKQLAGLLGLTDDLATLANAYLLVDTASAPGQGIVGETIQFHGIADLYSINGATALATLYLDATTASTYPAVTLNSVGSGYAAAFTYDLARSVVYTRQGNPDWAGQNRDGRAPVRSNDMFFGAASGDPQPDWIDLDKVAIPQADEQQRLLANLIGTLSDFPLPRFWYFPSGHKAVVIMTGDHHGCCANTWTRFDTYKDQSDPGCVVDDWECVRASSYVYPNSNQENATALSYHNEGFEVGLHVDTNCADWTPSLLESQYTAQMAAFATQFPSLPIPDSERNHCITWSDWVTQPLTMLNHGIRLDTNYYYWPPEWVQDTPGMFTGSGMVMRFADLDGTIVDVYQAVTQMTDESSQTYPFTSDQLLDKAVGPEGYYGAFTTNMHTDQANHAGSNAIVGSAQARGVPVVSGRQMLEWLDGRNASVFESLDWTASVLSFDVTVGTGARNLRGMVPTTASVGALTEITRGGLPITYDTETIKGVEYAVFDAQVGSYAASYDVDTTPPLISNVSATPDTDGTALVTWDTHEAADSRVDYGTDPGALTLNESLAGLVTAHTITLTGLAPNTTYYYRVTSADAFANSATEPVPPATLSFTTPAAICFLDTTVVDFTAGTLDANGYLSETGDGEVMLAPTEGAEFSGTSLPAGWTATPWTAGGDAVVSGGVVNVEAALLATDAFYGPGRILEFDATFTGDVNQHVGFGTDLNGPPWAIISTKTGGALYARTNPGTETETLLTGVSYGPHRFRIEWNAASVDYFVDGALVASHAVAIGANMRPVASDLAGGGTVTIDWIHMGPYASPSTFLSRVFGDGTTRAWGSATWTADLPAGTTLSVWVRDGDTPTPDGTWSSFVQVPASGTDVGGDSAYLQYRLDLGSASGARTPSLEEMYIGCDSGADITAPTVTGRSPAPDETNVAAETDIVVTFSERMDPATITTTTLRLRADGEVTDVPATVTSDGYTATLDPLSPLDLAKTYTVTVDAAVADTVGNTLGADDTWSFSTFSDVCVFDTSVADFGAGTTTDSYVAETSDGEVILQPGVGTEFSGTALPSGWQSLPWAGGGYANVGGGVITQEAARIWTDDVYGPVRTLEFTATFGAGLYQHVGLVEDETFNTGGWGMFSTSNTSTTLYARINGSGVENIAIPGSWIGTPHRYRIDWTATGNFVFWIDGVQRVTSTATVSQSMKIVSSDRPQLDGVELVLDWVRLSPYPPSGTFESRVLDAGQLTTWETLTATTSLPAGAIVDFETRTGNTPTPDGSWSSFATVSGGAVASPAGRYVQYQAVLTTSDDGVTLALEDVLVCGTACVSTGAPESVCNGVDDDCDGSIDEDYLTDESCFLPGACSAGNAGSTCVAGVETSCATGSPTGESEALCNGVDDDCDGSIDEDYLTDESCFLPGACSAGNSGSTCIAGVETGCATGSPTGESEALCNGVDDDCDGSIDEDYLTDESCFLPGACSAGNAGSTCVAGVETGCATGSPTGESEALCNGVDDDCDGSIDEDYLTDESCFLPGACSAGNAGSTCVAGVETGCATGSPTGESEALCNGVDDDCDGSIDEDYLTDESCFLPGACSAGNSGSTCVAGVETSCATGSPTGESEALCNGVDDDCDGSIDEDYLTDESCFLPGACSTGNSGSTCVAGVETSCATGSPTGESEALCNGVDDDCDGSIDEDYLTDESCFLPGACSAGNSGSTCVAGVETGCATGSPTGESEALCNGVDDDCDGSIDEDYLTDESCFLPGACSAGNSGSTCVAGVETGCATGSPTGESEALCNGVDDDCDGSIDEDYLTDESCFLPGACSAGNSGSTCVAGVETGCATGSPTGESEALCNGVDDDCDGSIDEDYLTDESCFLPGACSAGNSGSTCVAGVETGCATGSPTGESEALCNGVDDDCDGSIDEDYLTDESCFLPGACSAGNAGSTCVAGVETGCATGSPTGESEALCNGVDDDCDGSIDEDYLTDESCFLPGACSAGNSGSTCIAGVETGCATGSPTGESEALCNGVDDDCDGSIDEDYLTDESCFLPGACSAGNAGSTCVAGVETGCATGSPTGESEALCNGVDDDCDGSIDEDYLTDESCFLPGACSAGNAGSTCVAGVETSCATGSPTGESEALCNGVDDDCDGSIDEDYLADESCFLPGACSAGNSGSTCVAGVETGCATGSPTGESEALCNGVDDDCDGSIDEDYLTDESCFLPGACSAGNSGSTCVAGVETSCATGSPTGESEALCNGVDDDCDGSIDEDYLTDESCFLPGACSAGNAGSTCVAGVETGCATGSPTGESEALCNGVDDDCDGSIDEDYLTDESCFLPGACSAGNAGSTCVAGVETGCATGSPTGESEALCNGVDDDCDGSIDEDYLADESCFLPGACSTGNSGSTCVAGVETSCATGSPTGESEALCNGVDDDCDGSIDEDYLTDESCFLPGACSAGNSGSTCVAGVETSCATGSPTGESEALCNGVDDDCDGSIDEDYLTDESCFLPGACSAGNAGSTCVAGVETGCATGSPTGESEALCNGVDDDCDGSIDEDYLTDESCFLPGACSTGNSGSTCVAGVETGCATGSPTGESEALCNGVDDDCDGSIDEDYLADESCFLPGACSTGNSGSTCVAGVETSCATGSPTGESEALCNGVDDDCDGSIDEDYLTDESCFLPGACSAGNAGSTCVAGVETGCATGSPTGESEALCNGVDDDCDGSIDEDYLTDESCFLPGACSTGNSGSTCVAGVETGCATGSPTGESEALCNGVDDDCDGSIDEDYLADESCFLPGACSTGNSGSTCVAGVETSCATGSPTGESEALCNGVDDDCDGSIDEDYLTDESCFLPGACSAGNAGSTCVAGVETGCATGSPTGESEALCNGVDDDCDGSIDEDYLADESCFLPGACSTGNSGSTCVAGVETSCATGSPTGESEALCNGVDDDCDGSIDEDYLTDESCFLPGACSAGNSGSTCVAGVETSCATGSPTGESEALCNGVDDDCDGSIDEDYLTDESCFLPGACSAGNAGSTCVAGVETGCATGSPTGESEALCNGVDDDCDGSIDEDYLTDESCFLPGACSTGNSGSTCVAGVETGCATGSPTGESEALCNGVDDDCDGSIDEDYLADESCFLPGACSTGNSGSTCVAGVETGCATGSPTGESEALCNGVDDDCDGSIDEDYLTDESCFLPGACSTGNSGSTCVAGVETGCATGSPTGESEALCNGVDDDCDGSIDEDYLTDESCFLPGACSTGNSGSTCVAGVETGCATGSPTGESEALCNGVDDDCDGSIDEDYLTDESCFLPGACSAGNSGSTCVAGVETSCATGSPTGESEALCNGVDDDCDGSIDEDYLTDESCFLPGACSAGNAGSTCVAGVETGCATGSPTGESEALCNGVDDDCDGSIDEDYLTDESCFLPGACSTGNSGSTCVAGVETSCATGSPTGESEALCNGVDDDCDGSIDEDYLADESCFLPGACSTGNSGSTCVAGVETSCATGSPTGESEALCNGVDDDCDGSIDEDYLTDESCFLPGACSAGNAGSTCVAGVETGCATGSPTGESEALCNGVDDDCDGSIDEDYLTDESCFLPGACSTGNSGSTCVAGVETGCATGSPTGESEALCNGVDDDCDGSIDEDYLADESCFLPGACSTGNSGSTCVAGVETSCATGSPTGESEALCNGVDDDCDGSIDEDYLTDESCFLPGACSAGNSGSTCVAGVETGCATGSPTGESEALCNGVDDDCDGSIDEDYLTDESCFLPGACSAGNAGSTCVAGVETGCATGSPTGESEALCNGVDDDCDGSIDEDYLTDESCFLPGACSTGNSGSTCVAGVETGCATGSPTGESEALCNGVDDDCDGSIDEDYLTDESCFLPGACSAGNSGSTCVAGVETGCATGSPTGESEALCNGVDDDCDGSIDEDYLTDESCFLPGACSAGNSGSTCVAGVETGCATGSPTGESEALCNGVDDDCDGSIDEDYLTDESCFLPGACSTGNSGSTCVAGVETGCATGSPTGESEALCNGVDDDCDGSIDEDYLTDESCFLPGACSAGNSGSTCVAGVETGCATGSPTGESEALCNGVDDDCDGSIDEDYLTDESCFLPGACSAGNSGSTCVAGVETSCATGSPTGESEALCNGVDDDCDGSIDEDYLTDESCFLPGACSAGNAGSTCVAGVETGCATGSPTGESEALCNGVDDDCDGSIDEDYLADESCFLPGACSAGNAGSTCVAGVETGCATGSPTGESEALCNGVDDDCDGSIDEDYLTDESCFLPGACSAGNSGSTCVAGVETSCATGSPTGESEALCNGVDDDCDGSIDEDYLTDESCFLPGACSAGNSGSTCVAGVETGCATGSPTGESEALCNGVDDDCDGSIDEDYLTDESCFLPGACSTGNSGSTCVAGVETSCATGSPTGESEALCNGVDDDCDGSIDEDYLTDESCFLPGACSAGNAGSTCVAGVETGCATGSPTGESEALCNGVDDDCDGSIDEDYLTDESCFLPGACSAGNAGSTCVAGVETGCATGSPTGESEALCNGVDDDCDGSIDEDYLTDESCFLPGACSAGNSGSTCVAGVETGCATGSPTGESEALCNGVDDDCDGSIDEDYLTDESCFLPGACSAGNAGSTCVAGVETGCATGSPTGESEALCNGVDDDCDGSIDEDYLTDESCFLPGACSAGNSGSTCVAGVETGCATGSPTGESEALCNGVDDDCDGSIDEDYLTDESCFLPGACSAGNAGSTCVAGVETGCATGSPTGESEALCNGVDDDCDGSIDEDYLTDESCFLPGACSAGNAGSTCVAGVETGCATGSPTGESEALCNGVDDDCDGSIDEDYLTDESCFLPGACSAGNSGSTCIAGVETGCATGSPTGESEALCNGVDDDCDGSIDEDYLTDESCFLPGACSAGNSGSTCVAGVETGCATGSPTGESEALCNGVDDDCDGSIDEDYLTDESCFLPGACSAGNSGSTCVAGVETGCATGSPTGESEALCNGVDDDCDGSIDEDYLTDESCFLPGACSAGNAGSTCVAGVETGCATGSPTGESEALCNGVDDDCDGSIDEDYLTDESCFLPGACSAGNAGSTCVAGVETGCATGSPTGESEALCNGVDDDCDGSIDEDYLTDESCFLPGACSAGNSGSTCVAGVETGCATGSPTGESEALCNGVDDDCDGSIDEDYLTDESCFLPGACSAGNSGSTCVAGVETSCATGSPTGESEALCNGVDDDCDGSIDEDYLTDESCFLPGACSAGNAGSTCVAGVETGCATGSPTGESEALCNGVDDDCDGSIDEDYLTDESCFLPGACSAGNAGSTCVAGVETGCATGSPTGESEALCNGVDDDCDGSIDEDYLTDEICFLPGACSAGNAGSTCVAGVETGCATGSPTGESEALCNGVDDDCDGSIDEDYLTDESCFLPGACSAGNAGSTCVAGVETGCATGSPTGESEALCNGVDDDCDGSIDEDYLTDESCFLPGACSAGNAGSTCVAGVETGCATGSPTGESEALCNGVDDDCDGSIDEDYLADESCFLPGACSAGNAGSTCVAGVETGCATGSPTGESEALCNGVDDDCDGSIDEDYLTDESCFLPGACSAGNAGSTCVGGVETSCQTGTPTLEICDGLDNDCDGTIDNGAVAVETAVSIVPSTLNLKSQGNTFEVNVALTNVCDPANPIPIDASGMTLSYVSRLEDVFGTSIPLPDPNSLTCFPGAGERGIVENLAARSTNANQVRLTFSLPADGDCETLDGDRQDLNALLADFPHNEDATICVTSSVDGVVFEACGLARVVNKGIR